MTSNAPVTPAHTAEFYRYRATVADRLALTARTRADTKHYRAQAMQLRLRALMAAYEL